MADADGSVVIAVDLNVDEAEKEFARLRKRFISLDDAIQKASFRKNKLAEQSAQMAVNLDRAKEALYKMEQATKGTFSNEQIKEQKDLVKALQSEYDKLENEIDKCNKTISNGEIEKEYLEQRKASVGDQIAQLQKEAEISETQTQATENQAKSVEDLNAELDQLLERQQELNKYGLGLGLGKEKRAEIAAELEEVNQRIEEVRAQLGELEADNNAASTSLGDRIRGLLDQFGSISAVAGTLSVSFGIIRKGAVSLGKAFSSATKGVLKAVKNLNAFSKIAESIGPKLSRLGKMIRRVFVFSVITMGLRALRSQISSYLGVNTELSSALQRLKGAFLTAFQPIYDVIVPALATLINAMTRAIAVVAQFIATLFGTTASKAQANAKALNAEAKALKATGAAADDAAGSLAGFDEINTIQTENAGGGGGGGAGIGEDAFDYEYGVEGFESWGEAFSYVLDNILAGIDRLKDKFKSFSDWLNGVSFNLLEMFHFDGVRDKVEQIGVELADAFNKLVDWINWYQLGQALGAGFDLALLMLTSFIYSFDWIALGGALASAFNGLVSEIDWYNFGRLLWAGWKIGLETLAGFLLGLDMPQLAKAASNIVMGFFNSMLETIQKINWAQIGLQISTFLNNIDWIGTLSSIAGAIASGINAAIGALYILVSTLQWRKIGDAIGQAVNKLFADIDWAKAGQTFGGFLKGALEFGITLISEIDWGKIGSNIAEFINNIDWGTVGASIIKGLTEAFKAASEFVVGFINDLDPVILALLTALVVGVFSGLLPAAATAIASFFAGIPALVIAGIVAAAAIIAANWDNMVKWWIEEMERNGGDIVLGLLNGIIAVMATIGTWLKEHLIDPIVNGVKSLFGIHSPSTVMQEIGGFLIDGLLLGISETWHNIVEFFGEKLENLKQFLLETWENIKEKASEIWSSIKENIGNKWDEIKQNTSEKWQNIKQSLSDTWENVRSNAQTKFEEIRSRISEIWDNTKSNTSQKWEEIKSTLAAKWDEVKSSAGEKFEATKQNIIDIMGKLKQHDWASIGSSIMNGVWNGLKNVWESVKSWANGVAKWLGDAFSGAKNAVSGIISNVTGRSSTYSVSLPSIPSISIDSIPRLAQGAVIPPNRQFMAVLGDQSNGNNLEGPESMFRRIVREEAGGGGDYAPLLEAILSAIRDGKVIMVDRRVLGQVVTQEQNRMTRQAGRSVLLG